MNTGAELGNTAALFALILAAGFIAGKAGHLSKASQSGLTNLLLCVMLPCMIVNSFRVAYEPYLLWVLTLTLILACISQATGQALGLVFFRKQPHERRSVFRYGLIVSNSGFFGLSVVSALFGTAMLPFGAVYLIPQRFSMWLLGVPIFTKNKHYTSSMIIKTLLHPAMVAVYIGLTLMFTQADLPAAIVSSISVIGACTMPVSMLLIGAILAETKPAALLDKHIYLYCFLRLVVIPGITFLCCLLAGLDREILFVCVLQSGMPAATTTSLLALRYDADERLGSTIVVISTIIFFALLPAWLALFALVP